MRASPPLFRVVFGYQMLVDNCCDPDAHSLQYNAKLKRLLERDAIEESQREAREFYVPPTAPLL